MLKILLYHNLFGTQRDRRQRYNCIGCRSAFPKDNKKFRFRIKTRVENTALGSKWSNLLRTAAERRNRPLHIIC